MTPGAGRHDRLLGGSRRVSRRPARGLDATGDLGYRSDDGYLYVTDRLKDMIITGGENVYPREIEDVLYAHEAVREAAVIGAPDEEWGERVHAIIVVAPDASVTEGDLIARSAGCTWPATNAPSRWSSPTPSPRTPRGRS